MSIQTKQRDSNMELLRIVTMILVMIVHANFLSIQEPNTFECISSPLTSYIRYFIQGISIISVNVFVLLTGWYGVNFKINNINKIYFQGIFFTILVYITFYYIGIDYDLHLADYIYELKLNQYWFLVAYLILYILSPVLNIFCKYVPRSQFKTIILIFFVLQTIYGWFIGDEKWYENGYSPISFIGLYLLARYMRLYPNSFTTLSKNKDIIIYFLIVSIVSIISYFNKRLDVISSDTINMYAYTNPLVIIASTYFLLYFSKLSIQQNSLINWIASSAFAVYLLHCHTLILHKIYCQTIRTYYQQETVLLFFGKTILFIFLIFLISILLDKIRIYIWDIITQVSKKLIKFNISR